MQDTSLTEDTEQPSGQSVCVALDSIAVGDVAPEEGDTVTIEATVDRVEGDKAYVTPVGAVEHEETDMEEEPLDKMENRLRSEVDNGY